MITAQQLNDALTEIILTGAKLALLFAAFVFLMDVFNYLLSKNLHNKTHKKILELETSIDKLREEIKQSQSIDALREEIKAIKDQ